MNSRQISDIFKRAERRARAAGLTEVDQILDAMMADPEMEKVVADPQVRELAWSWFVRRTVDKVLTEYPEHLVDKT